MTRNQFGEMIYDENDICDLVMQGRNPLTLQGMIVDSGFDLEQAIRNLDHPGDLLTWTFPTGSDISVPDYDALKQRRWFMPAEYHDLDVATYVLDLCKTDAQLQRVGQELLMYQERGMFDLLRYLKYLVDVMRANHVIWGVGRGSSVASYVLYLLGVHRIDSMYYDLDPSEFLR